MKDENRPVSEINITPLTDVMLVLLIIFMISAPFIVPRGKEIHLPKVQEFRTLKSESNILKVSIDGSMELNGVTVNYDEYVTMLENIVDASSEPVNLFIRGDENVQYGIIVNVMDLAKVAGVDRIGLVTEVEEVDVTMAESQAGS